MTPQQLANDASTEQETEMIDLETLVSDAMQEDGEPRTPKEMAEHKVGMAVRDTWLSTAELFKLRCDPVAQPFISKAESDLWSIKLRIDLILSEIRADHGERELPVTKLKVVSNHG